MLYRLRRKRIKLMFSKKDGRNTVILCGVHFAYNFTYSMMSNLYANKLFFGTKRYGKSLFKAMLRGLQGMFFGFFSDIRTEGVGFRFLKDDENMNILGLSLGYSHPVAIKLPGIIRYRAFKYHLFLYGGDISLIKETALKVRGLRVPDAYKGKGLKFGREILKFKPGKQRQR